MLEDALIIPQQENEEILSNLIWYVLILLSYLDYLMECNFIDDYTLSMYRLFFSLFRNFRIMSCLRNQSILAAIFCKSIVLKKKKQPAW